MWRVANCANCTRRKAKKRSLTNENGVWPIATYCCKSRIDLAARAGIEYLDLQPDSPSGRPLMWSRYWQCRRD